MPTRTDSLISLKIAPAQVIRGSGALQQVGSTIAQLGSRPLLIGGDRTLPIILPRLESALIGETCTIAQASYGADCSESALRSLKRAVAEHQADLIIGSGGGKALDAAKLIADQCKLPIVTIPTSGATCAAWTALTFLFSGQPIQGFARTP